MTHLAALPDAVSAGEQITIARLRQFNLGQSLGGISIAELRDQGRLTWTPKTEPALKSFPTGQTWPGEAP